MSDDHDHEHNNHRGRHFPHNFNIGTTIQNVFRNINHAFASHHENEGQRDGLRDHMDYSPSTEPLNSMTTVDATHTSSSSAAPDLSTSSVSVPADAVIPPHSQLESHRDEGEESMSESRSVSDGSDESGAGIAPVPPQEDIQPIQDDHDSAWSDDEGYSAPVEPAIGVRRARVDDDDDNARDRRHPSERVGRPPSPGDAAPRNANPQHPPRPLPGLFGALFGMGLAPGGNRPGGDGDVPPEHTHTHTGEGTADPSSVDNNPTPGHAPRDAPILTAGFTLTIPLFGPPSGNRTGPPPAGGQGVAPGMMGMDAASREELFASFAAFFQEFQALDEAREDPERATKLVAGLEVVPVGLVKRLERVGGAPGGHIGDSSTEGSSSGCAICWDTLLDAEGDSFTGQHFSGGDEPQPETRNETHTDGDPMNVDGSASHPQPGTTSEPVKIISLPCAHVFHASCLLPWFTRAKQATCPTCRFNIDPENLTYSPPPRRVFQRGPTGNVVPNATPQGPLDADARTVDATVPQIDPAHDARPTAATTPPGPAPPPPTGQAGVPPVGPGFNPFVNIPGIPVFSFPAIQIPLRPPTGQAPGDENQGIDVVTIGLDMFVGVPPPPEGPGGDPRDNPERGDGTENGETATGAAGDNGANPNGFAQDLHTLIEGLVRTTQNIIRGPPHAPAPDAPPTDDAQPQPQVRLVPEGAGVQFVPPPMGGPRIAPFVPLRPNMFRPTRPMPPRRERKTWTLPPAPGPSLRQRVEKREREQGLRCSDTSCGIGPSDDDPYPEESALLMKQVHIRPLLDAGNGDMSVCAHAFHPECLVSAERVAGWGGEDKTESLVEVSCPVCRAVGCVTREEWELGVSAL